MRQVFNVVVAMGLLCAGAAAAERAYMEVPLKKLVVSESGFYVVREGGDAVSFRSLHAEKGRFYSVHPLSMSSVPEVGQKRVFLLSDAVRFHLVAAEGEIQVDARADTDGNADMSADLIVRSDDNKWEVQVGGSVHRDEEGNKSADVHVKGSYKF